METMGIFFISGNFLNVRKMRVLQAVHFFKKVFSEIHLKKWAAYSALENVTLIPQHEETNERLFSLYGWKSLFEF